GCHGRGSGRTVRARRLAFTLHTAAHTWLWSGGRQAVVRATCAATSILRTLWIGPGPGAQRSDSLVSADSELAQCETERADESCLHPAAEFWIYAERCIMQSCRGGSTELWNQLQSVLSSLESSTGRGRQNELQSNNVEMIQATHLSAARESWVQATQVLVEMERDLGICYPSHLPHEERRQYQHEVLSLYKLNQDLNNTIRSRQEELVGAERTLMDFEHERKLLQEKVVDLKRKWLYGMSCSPPMSPSLSSSRTSSPCFSSPPYPGSPLLSRRMPSPISRPDSPFPPCTVDSVLQAETEKLQRSLERLKARNERLNAALVRRKGESEQLSMSLSRQEADSSALLMALAYCEECEEAYSDLLSLHESKKHQSAETSGTPHAHLSTDAKLKNEAPSSPSEGATDDRWNSFSEQDFLAKTEAIMERISRLKNDRAAVCIPQHSKGKEDKISPDTGTLAGVRGRASSLSKNNQEEKAALLVELATVGEEMSDMRATVRLLEKERRCLDLSLMVQGAQDSARALMMDCLRDELGERKAIKQSKAEYQTEAGGRIPGPRNHSLLRELQAAIQREQNLKKRVKALCGSLDSVLTDNDTQKCCDKEEIARLSHYFSKVSSTHRSSQKKHQEQLWLLEKQITAMKERQAAQQTGLRATLEAMEWKREETIL
ncbi:hypothetical protein DNTS_015152, partial [Danionella cerebrum]